MSLKRVSPRDAHTLVTDEGYAYLDVRSVPEFEAGHPSGAYNIPLLHMGERGMQPNPDFLTQVQANFPPDAKLVIGCKAGGRSMRAAQMLLSAGFTDVIDQRAGFEASRDGFGQIQEEGWRPAGLPVSTQAETGRSFEELSKSKGG